MSLHGTARHESISAFDRESPQPPHPHASGIVTTLTMKRGTKQGLEVGVPRFLERRVFTGTGRFNALSHAFGASSHAENWGVASETTRKSNNHRSRDSCGGRTSSTPIRMLPPTSGWTSCTQTASMRTRGRIARPGNDVFQRKFMHLHGVRRREGSCPGFLFRLGDYKIWVGGHVGFFSHVSTITRTF